MPNLHHNLKIYHRLSHQQKEEDLLQNLKAHPILRSVKQLENVINNYDLCLNLH